MVLLGWIVLAVSWVAWGYPFAFRAPHNQKRPSITALGPTRAGLFLESLGYRVFSVSRRDLFHCPDLVLANIRRLLQAE